MCQALPTSATDDQALSLNVFTPDAGYSYFDMTPAQIAARVTSLNVAANLVISGDELCDRRLAGEVVNDLLETAAWLSRQLAQFFDDHDFSTARKGA